MKLTLRAGDEIRTMRVLRDDDWLRVTFEDGREVGLRLLSSRGTMLGVKMPCSFPWLPIGRASFRGEYLIDTTVTNRPVRIAAIE